MVPRRADQAEAGFRQPDFGRLDGAADSQGRDFVYPLAFNLPDMHLGVDRGDVLTASRLCLNEHDVRLDSFDDGLHAPGSRCRVPGVNLIEIILKNHLHRNCSFQ